MKKLLTYSLTLVGLLAVFVLSDRERIAWAQQATRTILLLGSTPVSASNPLPVSAVPSSASFGTSQVTSAAVSIASSGDNTVVTRTTGTIKVYGLILSCASALTTMTAKNGAGTTLGAMSNVSSLFLPISTTPYYTTTSTNNFVINLSSAVQCGGTVYYLDN